MARPILPLPHGTYRWCGPCALSVVSGKSTNHCVALANYNTRPAIKGMYHAELEEALRCLGLKWRKEVLGRKTVREPHLTLAAWAATRTEAQRNTMAIISVTGHYMVIYKDLTICTLSGRQWVHLLSSPGARKRIKRVWWIEG